MHMSDYELVLDLTTIRNVVALLSTLNMQDMLPGDRVAVQAASTILVQVQRNHEERIDKLREAHNDGN